jgi:hypothetical protein
LATNVTLQDLVRDYRAEVGHSLAPTQGVNTEEAIMYLLDRVQRQLWVEYDWPAKTATRKEVARKGAQFVDFPADMPYEGVSTVHVHYGNSWLKIEHGIHPEDLNLLSSIPNKWGYHADTDQMELCPVPSGNLELMFSGMLECPRMRLATDRCVLDDTLIVLRAAAETAARQKMADAKIKMDDAARFAGKLLSKQRGGKDSAFVYGGGRDPSMAEGRRLRPGIDYIPS